MPVSSIGVHSPTLSGLSQADAYRPFRLPAILIGDSRLGGISTTLTSYEALLIRGYSVEAVLLFHDAYYKNHEYLADYFSRNAKDTLVQTVPRPPPRPADDPDGRRDQAAMEAYYVSICDSPRLLRDSVPFSQRTTDSGVVPGVLAHIVRRHNERILNIASMPERTLASVWWPFVQHANTPGAQEKHKGVTVIDSAFEDFLQASGPGSPSAAITAIPTCEHGARPPNDHDYRSAPLLSQQFDGSASWWTQALGHAHPQLTLAAAHAAGRYGHVIFPLATHEPALALAERLLSEGGPGEGWANKVFFSDDGSTGMEVALKMAMRASALRYPAPPPTPSMTTKKRELHILGISGSYHGDTIGAMDASEGGVYNSTVEWHRERGFWFHPPRVGVRDGGRVTISIPAASWELDWDGTEGFEMEFAKFAGERPAAGGETGRGSAAPAGRTVTTASVSANRGDDGTLRVGFSDDPSLMRHALQYVYDVPARLARPDPLVAIYKKYITAVLERLVIKEKRSFGALVLEPILMGAGGMVWVDPLFQHILIDVVRAREDLWSHISGSIVKSDLSSTWRGLPVVFDEVFVGLYRLGFLTSSSILGTPPDISVLAKILTGGLVPMSVTLASNSIYGAFLGPHKKDALLHGHSYTAHPIGCAIAGKTLDIIREIGSGGGNSGQEWINAKERWLAAPSASPSSKPVPPSLRATSASGDPVSPAEEGVWSLWDPDFVAALSKHHAIDEVMSLGTVLAIQLHDDAAAGTFSF